MRSIRPSLMALGVIATFVSCAAHDAPPKSGVQDAPIPTAQPVAVRDTVPRPVVAESTATRDTTATTDTTPSGKPRITVPSVPGRSKRDSIALVSAVRAGMGDT